MTWYLRIGHTFFYPISQGELITDQVHTYLARIYNSTLKSSKRHYMTIRYSKLPRKVALTSAEYSVLSVEFIEAQRLVVHST